MIQHFAKTREATSLLSEVTVRPHISGRIRLGVKVLSKDARANPDAIQIYEDGIHKGMSYDAISHAIEREAGIKNPLRPDNTEMLNISPKDFDDPKHYDFLLERYGEELNGTRVLRSIDLVFPFQSIEESMPHRFAAFSAKALKYFSEYENGVRKCRLGPSAQQPDNSVRPVRFFGKRPSISRVDDAINEVCSPESCREFQQRECTLDLRLLFTVPGLKASGLLQVQTRSMMALYQWAGTLKLVSLASDLRKVTFTLRKKQFEISYRDNKGVLQKSKQWIPILSAPVALSELIQGELTQPEIAIGEVVARPVEEPMTISNEVRQKILHSKDEIANMNARIAEIENSGVHESDALQQKIRVLLKFHRLSGAKFQHEMSQEYGEEWAADPEKLKLAYSLLRMHTSDELAEKFSK